MCQCSLCAFKLEQNYLDKFRNHICTIYNVVIYKFSILTYILQFMNIQKENIVLLCVYLSFHSFLYSLKPTAMDHCWKGWLLWSMTMTCCLLLLTQAFPQSLHHNGGQDSEQQKRREAISTDLDTGMDLRSLLGRTPLDREEHEFPTVKRSRNLFPFKRGWYVILCCYVYGYR